MDEHLTRLLEQERIQARKEGKDLSPLEKHFRELPSLPPEKREAAAARLLDAIADIPVRPDFPYREPSELEGIRKELPSQVKRTPASLAADVL